ncbi:MAG: hypothetical protein U0Q12_00595 [Vicinamibacterales bacterium]
MPTPLERVVEMEDSVRSEYAELLEPPIPGTRIRSDAGQLPTHNAYSGEGDATGDLVYVNYGTPEDYLELDRLGVSVKGKVVIARYGRSWRGHQAEGRRRTRLRWGASSTRTRAMMAITRATSATERTVPARRPAPNAAA